MSTPANFLPQPLRVLAGNTLEAALGRALELDPETRAALQALEGRRVDFVLQAPPVALAIRVEDGRVRVGPPSAPGSGELGISATLGALLAQAAPWRDDSAPPVGKLSISGDAELARRVQRLAQRFDPDWDAALARALGDVLGHQVGKALRRALGWSRETARALAQDGAEWLTEESRDVVAGAELGGFLDDVDGLREGVERLEARLARLHRDLPAPK